MKFRFEGYMKKKTYETFIKVNNCIKIDCIYPEKKVVSATRNLKINSISTIQGKGSEYGISIF